MLVRVVGEPEQDQLADPVTTTHCHAEHERRGLDTHRSHPRGRQLASSRQRLAQLPNSTREHGEPAPLGWGHLHGMPVLRGRANGREQAVLLGVVPVATRAGQQGDQRSALIRAQTQPCEDGVATGGAVGGVEVALGWRSNSITEGTMGPWAQNVRTV
jgi:hypothetical protein